MAIITEKKSDPLPFARVCRFIENQYYKCYHANISCTYQRITAILDDHKQLLSAMGFKIASQEKLFLEQYFNRPIEQVLSTQLQSEIPRSKIIEFGNLTAINGRAAYMTLDKIITYLHKQGYHYAVMTATKQVRRTLHDIPFQIIGDAKPQKLEDGGENWGQYYDQDPKVITARLDSYQGQYQKYFLNKSLSAFILDEQGNNLHVA